MAYENLCLYCFSDNGGRDVCPRCGRDARAAVPQIQLMPGTTVYNDRFLVGRAIGQDASGIVYGALDTKRGVKLRLREYLPREYARRLVSGEVVPESGAEDAFEAGMRKLRASVEGVEDPAKRHFFFEENGTGYIAQRKNAETEDAPEETEARTGPRMAMIIAIAAALVVLVAIGVIALINYLTEKADERINKPLASVEDSWEPPVTASPTPYAQATFGAITDPELSWMDYTNPDLTEDAKVTPTPAPTVYAALPTSETIKSGSDSQSVSELQRLLIMLGWLDSGSVTGTYDSATRAAVRDFQKYINENYAINPKLSVDGVAGPKTLGYLTDVSMSVKPTPTPVPLTPAPTMNYAIDENSSAATVRYLQNQLITLGLMNQNGLTGKYDSATRAAVLSFQQRVNDLQGYDALPENGACDATTLAYVDFYADWWQSNRPTPAPQTTTAPTPTRTFAPEPEAGDYVDENSNAESIKFVQTMLIELGYLEGRADGSYGPKTYAAVKSFQNYLNAQMPGKVTVTGKCDVTTLSYLEYYYEQTGAGETPPTVGAPQITVTGAALGADGIYQIGEAGARVSWSAENAAEYSIYINDSKGISIKRQQSTRYTSMDVTRGSMTAGETYTFIVVAIPEGGGETDGLKSSVKLAAASAQPTPTPSADITPVITVSGAQSFTDGVYGIGANGAKMSWTASGAGSYSLYLTNSANEIIAQQKNTAITEYSINAAQMTAGEKYTFTVVAIPSGGLESQGKYASVRVALAASATPAPTQTPAPASIGAPVISVAGSLGLVEGKYWVGTDDIAITWTCTGEVAAYSYYLTDSRGGALTMLQNTADTSFTAKPSTMSSGEAYTLTVVAIPRGGSEENGTRAAVTFQLYEGQTPKPVYTVEAPVITVSGYVSAEGGTYYAGADALGVTWSAAGDLASYSVYLVSDAGETLVSTQNTERTGFVIDPADLDADRVYTLTVVAVPTEGAESDGASASISVAIKKYSVSAPVITVSGYESVDGGVYIAGTAQLNFSWTSEGDIDSYNVYLMRESGALVNQQLGYAQTAMAFSMNSLNDGETYSFRVEAVPVGGGDAQSATVYIRKAAKAVQSAPVIEISGASSENGVYIAGDAAIIANWSVSGTVGYYNIYLTDDSGAVIRQLLESDLTYLELNARSMTPDVTYTLRVTAVPADGGDGASAEVYLRKPAPETVEVGTPEITVSGNAAFENGVYAAGDGALHITWSAAGAESYNIYLLTEGGDAYNSYYDIDDTSIDFTMNALNPGEIYTFRVEAVSASGDTKDAEVFLTKPRAAATDAAGEVGAPRITLAGGEMIERDSYVVTGGSVTVAWASEGALSGYAVELIDPSGNVLNSKNVGADVTEMSFSTAALTAGEHVFRVTAVPEGGALADGSASEIYIIKENGDAPETPSYVNAGSDAETVTALQLALYNNGWLAADSGATPGVFDAATMQAVYDFQAYAITQQLNLEIVQIDLNSDNPTVDAPTCALILDAQNPIVKPEFE